MLEARVSYACRLEPAAPQLPALLISSDFPPTSTPPLLPACAHSRQMRDCEASMQCAFFSQHFRASWHGLNRNPDRSHGPACVSGLRNPQPPGC
jgi:hypothetical protein